MLEYRILCTASANYSADKTSISKDDTVTLSLSSDFTANIKWEDNGDRFGYRPHPATTDDISTNLPDLKLYSRDSHGQVEQITSDLYPWEWTNPKNTFSSSTNTWNLTIHGLPKYSTGENANEEIEYFLVYGTDEKPEGGSEKVTSSTLLTTEEGTVYTPHYTG